MDNRELEDLIARLAGPLPEELHAKVLGRVCAELKIPLVARDEGFGWIWWATAAAFVLMSHLSFSAGVRASAGEEGFVQQPGILSTRVASVELIRGGAWGPNPHPASPWEGEE